MGFPAALQRERELLCARELTCFAGFDGGAALDCDFGVVGEARAVLAGELGGDREVLPAEAVVVLEGEIGGQRRMRSLGERRFDGFEGDVGDRLKRRVGDTFFDRGLAVEDHRDAFSLQDELGVGPRGVAVRDQIDRARDGVLQNGGVHDRPADCPEGSDIGTAIVHTPVLQHAVVGPIYLVSHGNAAWPDAELVLQGEGITIILDGQTAIKKGITTSSFLSVPDVPFETVEADLPEGPHSALTTNLPAKDDYSLCGQNLAIPAGLTGQNGTRLTDNVKVTVEGCHAVKASKTKHLTRAQKLAKALKACRTKHTHFETARTSCERRARQTYAPGKTARSKTSKTASHNRRP